MGSITHENFLTTKYLQTTVYLAWLQSSTRKPQWLQYLKLVFLYIPNVAIRSVFQNQVTNFKITCKIITKQVDILLSKTRRCKHCTMYNYYLYCNDTVTQY